MKKSFEITKKQLVEAFRRYNQAVLQNPEAFGTLDDSENCAKLQAEALISYLPLRVFKFYTKDELFYMYSGRDEEEALENLTDSLCHTLIVSSVKEIPESKWNEKIVKVYEANDIEKKTFMISIHEAMSLDAPQLLATNDTSIL